MATEEESKVRILTSFCGTIGISKKQGDYVSQAKPRKMLVRIQPEHFLGLLSTIDII
jgi:hypothetical protein